MCDSKCQANLARINAEQAQDSSAWGKLKRAAAYPGAIASGYAQGVVDLVNVASDAAEAALDSSLTTACSLQGTGYYNCEAIDPNFGHVSDTPDFGHPTLKKTGEYASYVTGAAGAAKGAIKGSPKATSWLGKLFGGKTEVPVPHGPGPRVPTPVKPLKPSKPVAPTARTPAAEASGGAARLGETVSPLGRTYENSGTYLNDVAGHYGINLRGVKPVWDYDLAPGVKGLTKSAEGGWTIRINPGFADEPDLANTIAHELSHARDFQKGLTSPEGPAYNSGDSLEEWIYGLR